MEAIILGNPFLYDYGTLTPIVIPAYEADEAVIELTTGYNPYIIGSGSSIDQYWVRSATHTLRPILTTDKIVVGGSSFLGTEVLRVVGGVNITNLVFNAESTYINSIKDEDTLVSNSDHAIPTQQSVKAYVDNTILTGLVHPGDNVSLLVNDMLYLTTETDPIFVASDAYPITSTQISNWDTAFSWGDHSLAGYLTVETDPIFVASDVYSVTSTDIANWNTAYTDSHTHTNKSLLDSLISSGDGLQVLFNDGTYKVVPTIIGGDDTYVQYNKSDILAGDSTFFFSDTTKKLTVQELYVTDQIDLASDSSIYIDVDGSDNLRFTDTVSGSCTLASLIGGATTYWTPMTGGIYYTDYVGVNTPATLDEALTVNGNIQADDFNSSYLRYVNSNLLLGPSAGDLETGSNLLYIANSNTATPLIYGDFVNQELEFNADVYINVVKRLAFGDSTISIRRDSLDNLEFRDLNANSGNPILLSDLLIGDLSLYSLKSDFISYASVNSISAANLVTWGKASILQTGGSASNFLGEDGAYHSGGGGGVTPVDSILYWDTGGVCYSPYTSKAAASPSAGRLYSGTTDPSATNRLNYDGNLHCSNITSIGTITSTGTITSSSDLISLVLKSSGTIPTDGYFYTGATVPTLTATMLNYDGQLRATYIRGGTVIGLSLDGTPSIWGGSATSVSGYFNNATGNVSHIADFAVNNVIKTSIDKDGNILSLVLNTSGTTQTAGYFDNGTTNPTHTNRLNYDGSLYVSKLYAENGSTGNAILGYSSAGSAIVGQDNSSGIGIRGTSYTGYSGYFDQQGNANTTSSVLYLTRFNTGSYNSTGDFIHIVDNPTTSGTISGEILTAIIGTTERISLNPRVAVTGGDAYIFDTHNALTTSNLLNLKNQGTTKVFVNSDGEVELTTISKGIILKSPDGTRYRLTVANGGTLTITVA